MKESAVYLILYAVSIIMIVVGINGTLSSNATVNVVSVICLLMGVGLLAITYSLRD